MPNQVKKLFLCCWTKLFKVLPHWRWLNYIFGLPRFLYFNRHFPRSLNSPLVSGNDLIYHNVVWGKWTDLHRKCVDKEYAKLVAQQKSSSIKIIRTENVLRVSKHTTLNELKTWLKPFLGKPYVVKPTNGSGCTYFLKDPLQEADYLRLLRSARENVYKRTREIQYRGLESKLIVEEHLAAHESLTDYKFFCANGHVLACQVDLDRFTNHTRALCSIPDFKIYPVESGRYPIPEHVTPPPTLAAMIDIAAQLSQGFGFVRIDLYEYQGGVYFGEFTFTPGAGTDVISNLALSQKFAQAVLKISGSNLV